MQVQVAVALHSLSRIQRRVWHLHCLDGPHFLGVLHNGIVAAELAALCQALDTPLLELVGVAEDFVHQLLGLNVRIKVGLDTTGVYSGVDDIL